MITSKTVNENISEIVASYICNVKWENPVMLNALKILLEDTY